MTKLISVNDNNLTVAGYIPEGTIDTVIFDPPFESLYNGYDYRDFIERRIDAAVASMTSNGKFVSVNYSNAQFMVRDQLREHNITPDWTCKIRRNARGGRRLKDGPDLIIRCFSREESDNRDISFGDAHHKAGNNGVPEGMPMREIEGILHSLNIDESNIVLDMFGGSGAVALAAHSYGAQCITIENIFQRYNNINDRLSNFVYTPRSVNMCRMKTCNKFHTGSEYLCGSHNGMLQYYHDRPVFIGEDITGRAITTGEFTPIRDQINMAGIFAHKAELRADLAERKEKVNEFIQRLGYSPSSFQTYHEI